MKFQDKINPTQYYLLVQLREDREEGSMIVLPSSTDPNKAGIMVYGHVLKGGGEAVYVEGTDVLFLPQNIIAQFPDMLCIIPASAVYAIYHPPKVEGVIAETLCEDCGAVAGQPHEVTCPSLTSSIDNENYWSCKVCTSRNPVETNTCIGCGNIRDAGTQNT